MSDLHHTARSRWVPWLYGGLALLEVGGRWLAPEHAFHLLSKPLPLLVLLLWYLGQRPPWGRGWPAWLMPGALLGSWAGDVLLMFPGDGFFLGGLTAFLTAHLCYTLYFGRAQAWRTSWLRRQPFWLLLVLVPGVGLLVVLWSQVPPGLRLPVAIYAGVITLMLAAALHRRGAVPASSFARVTAGALLFLLSDSLLAVGRFATETIPLPQASFWVMLTYLAAQYLIVSGVLAAPES